MPFVPLTPEEVRRFPRPCRDRQHDPPMHFALRGPKKWRCPSCGREVILLPRDVRLHGVPYIRK